MENHDEERLAQLNEEADIAADYLEGLLDVLDYDGDIEISIHNNRPIVQIVAEEDDDIKNLVGRKGEVVGALQQLTRLAVQQQTSERSKVIVDVNNFLKKKRQRIYDLALDAIEEVQDTGEPIRLKPMNSFERKIVHDLVREEGLKSKSHGEEPRRSVTIYLPAAQKDQYEDDEDTEEEGEDRMEFEEVFDI